MDVWIYFFGIHFLLDFFIMLFLPNEPHSSVSFSIVQSVDNCLHFHILLYIIYWKLKKPIMIKDNRRHYNFRFNPFVWCRLYYYYYYSCIVTKRICAGFRWCTSQHSPEFCFLKYITRELGLHSTTRYIKGK